MPSTTCAALACWTISPALSSPAAPRMTSTKSFRLATRSGMRLHLTDYHLAMARLHHSREHFLKAEALIAATGYHRRDAELEALRQTLKL